MSNILNFFHHIHHCKKGKKLVHVVEHCGNAHAMRDKDVNYINMHCVHNKHFINVKNALGHDANMKAILFTFNEKCGNTGWHIESGTTTMKHNADFSKELHQIRHSTDMKHICKHNNTKHCNIHNKHMNLSKNGHVHIIEQPLFC